MSVSGWYNLQCFVKGRGQFYQFCTRFGQNGDLINKYLYKQNSRNLTSQCLRSTSVLVTVRGRNTDLNRNNGLFMKMCAQRTGIKHPLFFLFIDIVYDNKNIFYKKFIARIKWLLSHQILRSRSRGFMVRDWMFFFFQLFLLFFTFCFELFVVAKLTSW